MTAGEVAFLSGHRTGETVALTRSLVAGRSPDCSLEVPDPNASREHCRLIVEGMGVLVADCGSSNGTFVNEQRVTEPHRLADGDVLRLGETRLRIRLCGAQVSAGDQPMLSMSDDSHAAAATIVKSSRAYAGGSDRDRLDAMVRVTQALANIRDVDRVVAQIIDALFAVFPRAQRCFLLLGSRPEDLSVKAARQRSGQLDGTMLISTSICRHAIERRESVLFIDGASPGFVAGDSIIGLGIGSAMAVPLIADNQVQGLLVVDTGDRQRGFSEDDLQLADTVGHQVAIALHHAHLLAARERDVGFRQNLCRFMPRAIADQVLDGSLNVELGGRDCDATVLFADLVGFTTIAEALDPSAVIDLVNACFARLLGPIERRCGSVDKFMGDAVMAVWGVPLPIRDSAEAAALAAIEMQNHLFGMRPPGMDQSIQLRIGLNAGNLVAGNVGTAWRSEYTVIGDTVNVAQRLQAAASPGEILVSRLMWERLHGRAIGRPVPPLHLKNRASAIEAHRLIGMQVGPGEHVLHVPVRVADAEAVIQRRLPDGSLVLQHKADHEPTVGMRLSLAANRFAIITHIEVINDDGAKHIRIRLDASAAAFLHESIGLPP